VVASAKIGKFLSDETPEFSTNEEVDVLVYAENEVGYNCIINNAYLGILYDNEVFEDLDIGQKLNAFVNKVRPEDGKTDLLIQPSGYAKMDDISKAVLEELKDSGGYIPVSDKSPADRVYERFGISKKNFKKALGALYKQRLIEIEKMGIRLKS
jgi:predicted RNA-binding protein (virulence factor B family)